MQLLKKLTIHYNKLKDQVVKNTSDNCRNKFGGVVTEQQKYIRSYHYIKLLSLWSYIIAIGLHVFHAVQLQ